MYKNIDEEMKAGKRASANIAIACFILLVLAITISYIAGWIDSKNVDKENVELFNTSYDISDSTWITKRAYKELELLLQHYEIYSEEDSIYFIRLKREKEIK